MSVQASFDEAATHFAQALQDAWTLPHIQERGSSAYASYLQALQDPALYQYQQRMAQAYGALMQVVAEALQRPDVQARARDAYRDYVHALQDAWTKLDADTVDPEQLLAISQSMTSTAWSAGVAMSAASGATAPLSQYGA